ncbi:MAG: glycerophosphodiester phosphodiesterase [Acidimicrobiia bacterium]
MKISHEALQVVGHHGWPARFPDNALAGLLAASAVAEGVEVDVRRSADGKLVLSHDPIIGGLVVAQQAWSVLAELDLGGGNHPALLDEAMASLPSTSFQLEIKNLPHEPGFEPDHRLALETAARVGPGDMVTSFNWNLLAAVRRSFPEVATGVLVTDPGDMNQAIEECLDVGHQALIPSIRLPVLGLARAIELGLQVFPWVVNEVDRIDELASLGVSGMITDDPGLVRTVVGRSP